MTSSPIARNPPRWRGTPSWSLLPIGPLAPKRTLNEIRFWSDWFVKMGFWRKEREDERSTIEVGEQAVADEAWRLGSAVAVIDADEGGGRRGEHLALVLEGIVGLNDGDGELAVDMGLQVYVPHQAVAAADPPKAPLQRPQARAQHRHPLLAIWSLQISGSFSATSAVTGSWNTHATASRGLTERMLGGLGLECRARGSDWASERMKREESWRVQRVQEEKWKQRGAAPTIFLLVKCQLPPSASAEWTAALRVSPLVLLLNTDVLLTANPLRGRKQLRFYLHKKSASRPLCLIWFKILNFYEKVDKEVY